MWHKKTLKNILFENNELDISQWEFKREKDSYWEPGDDGDGWVISFTNKETGDVVEDGDSQFSALWGLQQKQWDKENAEKQQAKLKAAPKPELKPDRGPRYKRRSNRIVNPVDTAIDDQSDLRVPFSLNNSVGGTNAGRVGGLIGSQLFRQFINFSVTDVTTRSGDTSPDIALRVYDGVRLEEEFFDPKPRPGEDSYLYHVVGDGIEHHCELGLEGKRIYIGRFLLDQNGIPQWNWNSNLTTKGQKLAESVLGANPDLTNFRFNPGADVRRRLTNLNPGFWTASYFNQLSNSGRPYNQPEMTKLFQATSDSYYMKIDRSTLSARICRAGFEEMEYGITGHTERAEKLAKERAKGLSNRTHFQWATLMDPDVNEQEADLSSTKYIKDMFTHVMIPTIADIARPGRAELAWEGRQRAIKVQFNWNNWDWGQCPELEFKNDAISILADAIAANHPELLDGPL